MVSRRPADPSVPIVGEEIHRTAQREIRILVASEHVTITEATYAAGERVAAPHVHGEHTDAVYVLDGELTFEIGCEATTITVSSGGFVAVPPGLHTRSGTPATALHAGSRFTRAMEVSPNSCGASATASRSSGTSPPRPATAARRRAPP
jgi:quercetin dioxygenase-like cupin family protein